MGQHSKCSFEMKLSAVTKYLEGNTSLESIARSLGTKVLFPLSLVIQTFDVAHEKHLTVKPLFHSDRGYQYTSKSFRKSLDKAEMTQGMSRVSRCIISKNFKHMRN